MTTYSDVKLCVVAEQSYRLQPVPIEDLYLVLDSLYLVQHLMQKYIIRLLNETDLFEITVEGTQVRDKAGDGMQSTNCIDGCKVNSIMIEVLFIKHDSVRLSRDTKLMCTIN